MDLPGPACALQAQQQQKVPNGDLNGGCSTDSSSTATKSNAMNDVNATPSASVALDLAQMEMQHFQLRLNVGGRSAQLSLSKVCFIS